MDETGEVPENVGQDQTLPDNSNTIEQELDTRVDLLSGVLALPQKVVEHIQKQGEARNSTALLVRGVGEKARSYHGDEEFTRELTKMEGELTSQRSTNDSDEVRELMQIDPKHVDAIRSVAFQGETLRNAMRAVGVDFPSALQHRINGKKGTETTIGLKDRKSGKTIENISLNPQLQIILDAEAARVGVR